MGKIKKILENELVGGTQNTDVYPVTSVKAVYDENNERLDHILNRRGVVNISTNYNADHTAEVLTLEQAIAKVPSKDRVLGFQGRFLSENGWKSYVFIGDSIADWTNKTKWNNYLTGTDIVQELGNAKDKAMSQNAITEILKEIDSQQRLFKLQKKTFSPTQTGLWVNVDVNLFRNKVYRIKNLCTTNLSFQYKEEGTTQTQNLASLIPNEEYIARFNNNISKFSYYLSSGGTGSWSIEDITEETEEGKSIIDINKMINSTVLEITELQKNQNGFSINKGEILKVYCKNYTGTGNISVFINPYKEDSSILVIRGNGKYEFKADKSGIISVVSNGSYGTISILKKSDVIVKNDVVDSLNNESIDSPLSANQGKKLNDKLFGNIKEGVVTTSFWSIKDQNIIKENTIIKITVKSAYSLDWLQILYREKSSPIGQEGINYTTLLNLVANKEYTYSLVAPKGTTELIFFQPTIPNYNLSYKIRYSGQIDEMEAKISSMSKEYIVDKNGSGDFSSITEAFIALKDDFTQKTILVKSGIYDIFKEIGGEDYCATIKGDSSQWYKYCTFLPPNTKLIGIGNVIMTFNPTKEQIGSGSDKLSPLNIENRGNSHVENITIECTNCRYGIHDESRGKGGGFTHYYKNVRVKKIHGEAGFSTAFACGYSKDTMFIIEDCCIDGSEDNNAWSAHTSSVEEDYSNFLFKNSIFLSRNTEASLDLYTNPKEYTSSHVVVNVNNCYLSGSLICGRQHPSEGVNYINPFDVTMYMNNKNVATARNQSPWIYQPKIYE